MGAGVKFRAETCLSISATTGLIVFVATTTGIVLLPGTGIVLLSGTGGGLAFLSVTGSGFWAVSTGTVLSNSSGGGGAKTLWLISAKLLPSRAISVCAPPWICTLASGIEMKPAKCKPNEAAMAVAATSRVPVFIAGLVR